MQSENSDNNSKSPGTIYSKKHRKITVIKVESSGRRQGEFVE